MDSSLKKIWGSIISMIAVAFMTITTFAINNGEPLSAVIHIREPKFSVTVPTSLPIAVDSSGSIFCSTTTKITNHSDRGKVSITDIQVESDPEWAIVDWNTDMQSEQVNTKKLGFQINDCNSIDGDILFNKNNFPVIKENASLHLNYNAKIPVQTAVYDHVPIAETTFIVKWDSLSPISYDVLPSDNPLIIVDDFGKVLVPVGTDIHIDVVSMHKTKRGGNWSCDDPSILQINSETKTTCDLTAIDVGKTSVIYQKNDVMGKVLFETYIPLDGISLDREVLMMPDVDTADTLTVFYHPENTTDPRDVDWSVYPKNVVGIQDGLVTAKNFGEATVTATVNGKTAACKVIVDDGKPHGSGMPIDKDMFHAELGRLKGKITFSRKPAPPEAQIVLNKDASVLGVIDGENAIIYSVDGGGVFAPIDATELFMADVKEWRACSATELDLKGLDTSLTTNMNYMFASSIVKSLDVSLFDTSNVTTMDGMFYSAEATSLDLRSFDTSNVTSMYRMFCYVMSDELNLTSFDTTNVTNMGEIFYSSNPKILDLSSFNTINVTETDLAFNNSSAEIVYCRTKKDARKFQNSSYCTPTNFVIGHQKNQRTTDNLNIE